MRVDQVDAAATTALRRAVLRPTWAPGTPMPADDDPTAVHLAAIDGDEVVGACVLFAQRCPHHPEVDDAWQLRGMATAQSHQGRGVGAQVLRAAIDLVADRGATLLWCKARVSAMRFYAAHGFVVDSDVYLEAEIGLPHRDMSRRITPVPS